LRFRAQRQTIFLRGQPAQKFRLTEQAGMNIGGPLKSRTYDGTDKHFSTNFGGMLRNPDQFSTVLTLAERTATSARTMSSL
jgi:hypothetical protein